MSDIFTDTTRLALKNLSRAITYAVNPAADRETRAREAARDANESIGILQELVGQFYREADHDLHEEVLLNRQAVDNALSWIAENLGATARSGSLLLDAKSASAHEALIKNWYQQARDRSYEDETHFI